MESKKPIAIVTGSSSGFGQLTCLELAANGFFVVATMRNLEKARRLQEMLKKESLEQSIVIELLDVAKPDSITAFGKKIRMYGKVDLLVNNAGFAAGGFVEELLMDDFREQFETNFFGLVAVTQLVIPMMREQGRGKIINISSISGLMGFPGLSPYVASKHAVEGFSESLRLELSPFGIDVILIEPGSYRTNIWTTGKKVTKTAKVSPYASYMKNIEDHLEKSSQTYGDPGDVARLITTIAMSKRPKLRYPIGKGVRLLIRLKRLIPWRQWERLILKKLKKRTG
ncbi:oxidoreductase [Fictibacillus sp. Mic-4]|uniref:oxidoreductase n=1 Tax=Fictibacillus sp. Mic-4 TaxID=3132826 RepID=UPI003CF7B5FE